MTALWSLSQTPYYDFLLIDESIYHNWAKAIAAGEYFPQAPYEFSPLPAYVMALVYRIFSADIFYIRIVNLIFGVFTCLFIALSGKQIGGALVGVGAGLVAALYEPFILYSIVPLKTALSLLLCSAILNLFLRCLSQPSLGKSLLTGICVALAINVRGNYLAFIPVVAPAVFWSGWHGRQHFKQALKVLLAFCFGLVAVLAPFTIRNYVVAGKFVLSTTQSGFNLYIGNNPQNSTPYFKPVAFASPSPQVQGVEFTIEASRRTGKSLSPEEASRYWTEEVFRQAGSQPVRFIKNIAQKVLALLNRFEAFDHYDGNFLGQFARFFTLPLFNFWLVWPLGMSGLILGTLTSKVHRWVAFLFCAYAGTLVLYFMSGRYRLPLVVILLPFAVSGIQQVIGFIKNRLRLPVLIYSLVLAVSFLLLFTPLPGANDLSLFNNIHAAILASQGRQQEALAHWEKAALANQKYSDTALISLADAACQRGEFQQAEQYLYQVSQESYKSAAKYDLLGDIRMTQRNWNEAADAYQKSLLINSSNNRVRQKLITVLHITNPPEADRQVARFIEISSFYKGL